MSDTALKIDNLKFRYPGEPGGWIVDVSSLTLAAGEQASLRGGSGAGKSTLLQLVAGLLDPVEGSVEVNGRDIHALTGAKRDLYRGERVGMIFQTFNLLQGFSAAENVMMAMMFSRIARSEHHDRAKALLSRLGVERTEAEATQLSVGQQQRVAVARALACDPTLVLADEPTASLDPENTAIAIELIQGACREKGAALLCVSHDPSVAERFERRERFDALTTA